MPNERESLLRKQWNFQTSSGKLDHYSEKSITTTCNRSSKLTTILRRIQAEKYDCASLRSLYPTREAFSLEAALINTKTPDKSLSEYAEASIMEIGEPSCIQS